MILDLIEENKRLMGNEAQCRVKQRHALHHFVDGISILRNRTVFRILHKIDLDDTAVIGGCEMPDGGCFTDLPRSLDDEWLAIAVGFPIQEKPVDLPAQVHCSLSSFQNIQRSHSTFS